MTVRVGVTGPGGRMGRMLLEAITDSEAPCVLAAAVARPGSSLVGTDVGQLLGGGAVGVRVTDDLLSVASAIDVLIDFTLPEATLAHAQICAEHGVPMVIGTTGFTDDQSERLASTTTALAVCQSSNFAPGVNLTFQLVEAAAKALGDSVDVEIMETHHRHKIDAPSGTALSLGEAVARARGRDLFDVAVHAREGRTGARPQNAIGFSSIRAGDIVGDHTVVFAGDGERLEITHRAGSRQAFASGAVTAACWLVKQPTGRYDMQDVLTQQESAR